MSSYSSVAFALKKRENLRNEFSRLSLSESSAFPPPSLFASSFGALSSPFSVSNRWTLWRFDCRDFPIHCKAKECAFCAEVNKLRSVAKNIGNESKKRWETYLKREKSFDDQRTLLKVTVDSFQPSKLAKSVFFNHKLGVAIFRGDIPPKYESFENLDGGIFQLQLFATSGRQNMPIVQKFDTLFNRTLRLLFDLPAQNACHVSGVFFRCELNPGKRSGEKKQTLAYGNLLDLPFIAKFEIWIDRVTYRTLVQQSLIDKINALIAMLGIPVFHPFRFRSNSWADKHSRK